MTPTTLPAPVRGYIAASNAFDGDAVIAWFADDAMVNDARRELQGADAIRRWLDREVIGDKVTMEITAVAEHHGDFTDRAERIVRLIIIHNEPTPAWAEG
jgi:ketosteroid isomerase-like protein